MSALSDIAKSKDPKAIAALLGLGAASQSEDSEAMFRGPKGLKRADHVAKVSAAKDLEGQGKSAREIWDETNAYKDSQGNWMTEYDDRKATFNKQNYFSMLNDPKGIRKSITDVLDHPEVFDAYPELKDFTIGRLPGHDDARADVNLATKHIRFNKDLGAEEANSSIMHELQHVIQKMEGWPEGGSSSLFSPEASQHFKKKGDDTAKQLSIVRMQINNAKKSMDQAVINNDPSAYNKHKSEVSNLETEKSRLVNSAASDFVISESLDPVAEYFKLMGERQARITQGSLKGGYDQFPTDRDYRYPVKDEEAYATPADSLSNKFAAANASKLASKVGSTLAKNISQPAIITAGLLASSLANAWNTPITNRNYVDKGPSIEAPVNPSAQTLADFINKADRKTKGSISNLLVPTTTAETLSKIAYGRPVTTGDYLMSGLEWAYK